MIPAYSHNDTALSDRIVRHRRAGHPRALVRIAWSLWVVTMALAVMSLILRTWNSSSLLPDFAGAQLLGEVLFWAILIPAAVPAYATVGIVVARRRPENGIGWLCLLLGLLIATQDVAWSWRSPCAGAAPGATSASSSSG